ncbi:MAG: hypothetical protein ACI81R_003836 [Bradymonadia bacterium]|jgi:hypothetical protein
MNARAIVFAIAALAAVAIAIWLFGAPTLPRAPETGVADGGGPESVERQAEDAGLALDADSGPPTPGPAVRAPSARDERAANSPATGTVPAAGLAAGAVAGTAAQEAAEEAAEEAAQEEPGLENTPSALGARETQFARFVAVMDTRYESFRQGAEDCVESLPSSLNAQLEVRITRNDLGDPYTVNVTGADLPPGVVDCLTRKARAIELPEPFRVDPYESGAYDVDSQTDSEFDWITRIQLGG